MLAWTWKAEPDLVVAMATVQALTPDIRIARASMPMEYDDTTSFPTRLGVGEKLVVPTPPSPSAPPFATYTWDTGTHLVTLTAVCSDRERFGTLIGALDDLARSLRIADDLTGGESPDVLRLPLSTIGSDQGPALGSAIHAAVAAGAHPDVRAAAAAMGSRGPVVYTPDPEQAATYDRLFAEYVTLHDWFVLKGTPGPQPKQDKCRDCINGVVERWNPDIEEIETVPCPTCAGLGGKPRPQKHARNNASHLLVVRKEKPRK